MQQAEILIVNSSSLRNAQSDIIHQSEALSFHKSKSSAPSPIKGSISSYNVLPPVDHSESAHTSFDFWLTNQQNDYSKTRL